MKNCLLYFCSSLLLGGDDHERAISLFPVYVRSIVGPSYFPEKEPPMTYKKVPDIEQILVSGPEPFLLPAKSLGET